MKINWLKSYFKPYIFNSRSAQAMILTTLSLGGSILGATTIAGFLMVYQFRQASDLSASTRSIYAADAGIEWGLYKFFVSNTSLPSFTNGASVTVTCLNANFNPAQPVDCSDNATGIIRAVGGFGNVNRALEMTLTF